MQSTSRDVPHSIRRPGSTGSDSWVGGADLDLARRRLAKAALLYSVVYLLAWGGGTFATGGAALPGRGIAEAATVASILLGLTAAVAFHRRWIPDARLLVAGTGFWILGGLGIDLGAFDAYLRLDVPPGLGLSWVCVWIMAYPMLFPAEPRGVLVASLLTATTGPASFAVAAGLHGLPAVPDVDMFAVTGAGGYLFGLFYPYYLCALLAWASAYVVHALRRDAARALELGSYRLERRIGAGGMGEVWLARHRLLARPAAIKVLHPEARGDDARTTLRRRFEREARATAGLRSVHTVDLYDFGVTEEGSFFYAMELLEGLDLEELIRREGPLPPARAVHFLLQACDSLQEAHDQGLVHRDVKPSNLFVTRLGNWCDVLKVLDFGLVTMSEELAGEGEPRLTVEGKIAGSPTTMPPEAALRGGYASDARSDLYSLGCVAWWMLSGRPVFDGDSPIEVVLQHVRDDPGELRAACETEIPQAVESIVQRCLAKAPEDRFGSVSELARELRACGVPAWTREDASKWWRVHGNALRSSQSGPETAAVTPEPERIVHRAADDR